MKKLNLDQAAGEFDMIGMVRLFYNIRTGEFGHYMEDSYDDVYDDREKFEEDCWIAAPDQYEINEYDIMVDFKDSVTDPRANELLSVALEGKGAFRRFKDTLYRVDLEKEWYAFRHKAYVEVVRRWCENNKIPYE